ncbi:MAG TPA: hypothetical protein DCQ99_03510 [Nitrospinae bacterium]|nr:hypothetical protein [Nitrospinota bacterium]HBA27326.1 hypothetical protein [Nitrospinota bacterium]
MKTRIVTDGGRITCGSIDCIHNENPLCLIFIWPYPPNMIEDGGYCSKYKRREVSRGNIANKPLPR